MDPLLIVALCRLAISLLGGSLVFVMACDRDSQWFPLWTRWTVGLIGTACVVGNGLAELWPVLIWERW